MLCTCLHFFVIFADFESLPGELHMGPGFSVRALSFFIYP